MRRLFPLAALLVAACASTPPPVPAPRPTTPAPTPVRSGLSGLTEAELIQRFGNAPFRVREGAGLKLQWQDAGCVLDVYLYPPASGAGAVTVLHADARRPGSGEALPVEGCAAGLAAK